MADSDDAAHVTTTTLDKLLPSSFDASSLPT
jgi:hypothetical protein